MSEKTHRLIELALLFSAVLLPMFPIFLLATTVDGDEYLKGGIGAAISAAVLTAYKAWKGTGDE